MFSNGRLRRKVFTFSVNACCCTLWHRDLGACLSTSQEIGYVPCECLLYVSGLGVEGGSGRLGLCPSWYRSSLCSERVVSCKKFRYGSLGNKLY